MRSLGIVHLPPCFDLFSCVSKGSEPVKVQALISELSLEAFDKAILHRFPGIDMDNNKDVMLFCPCKESLCGTFRPIIHNKVLWFSPGFDESVKDFRYSLCRN